MGWADAMALLGRTPEARATAACKWRESFLSGNVWACFAWDREGGRSEELRTYDGYRE